MKPQRTWILVADGTRARIFLNDGPGHGVRALSGCDFTASNDQDRDIQADRPGRTFDSAGSGRHALEPTSSPKENAKRNFARELVANLVRDHDQGHFDRLIIVAAPKMLGDLRSVLPSGLTACLAGELAKDLTHLEPSEIAPHLEDVLAV